MRISSTLIKVISGVALVAAAGNAPAQAAAVINDVATVNWGEGTMDCDSSSEACSFEISQDKSGFFGCSQEVTSTLTGPAVLHRNTGCSASVVGFFTKTPANSEPCKLTSSGLHVNFNSGVSFGFSGGFRAPATFEATRMSPRDKRWVKEAEIVVNGPGVLDGFPPLRGFGQASMVFHVAFPPRGEFTQFCTGTGVASEEVGGEFIPDIGIHKVQI